MDLSIVVPAKNEARRLPDTVRRLRPFLAQHGSAELVLTVDTGSEDSTVALANELAGADGRVRVVTVPSRGKGNAVRAGVRAARGDVVLTADTDLAVDPAQFDRLLEVAARGEVAIASRSVPEAVRVGEPSFRYLMGRLFNVLVRSLVLPGIRDSQCGFKAFPRPVGERLFEEMHALGWVFDVEFLARARREGVRVREVPVTWTYGHGSTLRPARDTRRILSELWTVRRRIGRVPGQRTDAG